MEIKEKREKISGEKVIDSRPEVHWPHVLPKNRGATKTI